jgi:tetratricopeptide (TPR) repeat protein
MGAERFTAPPDPGDAGTLDDLVDQLRLLKVWAGDPSYERITERVNAGWSAAGRPPAELARKNTVADCFKPGRRRWNADLVMAVVRALHPRESYVTQWRQALRVVGGEAQAASQVRVQDTLPPPLTAFTGRSPELDRLRRLLGAGEETVVAIEGMAGVGKTQLAVHIGHLLLREGAIDRVLLVNLRGFHPDAEQPPADSAAVLDGFLRLLGVPGQQIPHDLPARVAAYREHLAGTRTLIILDNAAGTRQIASLLPATPGCPALVTSRRSLTDLDNATHLTLGVFTPPEACKFLARVVPQVRTGTDPSAAARIAARCGYLPLVLELVAAHIRDTPGWTLTDHADRLDERHRDRRLDSDVDLALDVSYQHLRPDYRKLLRYLALHPGSDFDGYAAAALADLDLPITQAHLHRLRRDHLLEQTTLTRFAFHDLVQAFAVTRAGDEDPPAQRRAALTRLFDYYVGTAAAAMDSLFPAEAHRRPKVDPPSTPTPGLSDPDTARAWLDSERDMLVAVAGYAATQGWPAHTIALSGTLWRYLNGGYFQEAVKVHTLARDAAVYLHDEAGEAMALRNLGFTRLHQVRLEAAAESLSAARALYERLGDHAGQAFVLDNLGVLERRRGQYQSAIGYHQQALALHRQIGRRDGEARALISLGVVEEQCGRLEVAADHHASALALFEQIGHRFGTADALGNLSFVEMRLGRHDCAHGHMLRAMDLFQQDGNRIGEAWILTSLGSLDLRRGNTDAAVEYQRQALAIFRETGERDGEAWTLNCLGEVAHSVGRYPEAIAHYLDALAIAGETGYGQQRGRAHTGIGDARRGLGEPVLAREHYEQALAAYTELGAPEAEQVRQRLAELEAAP